MQEKKDVSKFKILFVINNYSYFSHSKITGPKSMLALIGFLHKKGMKIDICIPNLININFPHNVYVHNLSPLKIIRLALQSDMIVVDRHFFFRGWFLSKIFRKKLCLRLLGLGGRLTSKRLVSKKNFIKALTHISPTDLVISTLDASASEQQISFIRSHKVSHRVNGIKSNKGKYVESNNHIPSFFFVGRDSPEKGLSLALEIFSQIKVENKRLDVFGPTLAPQKYQYLLEQGAVQLHGFCDREKIEKLTLNHSIMISCNKLGALGNAELEALAAGKYIIYGGPEKFLSYLPKQLLFRYGRNYSEILSKINSNTSQKLHITDFNSVHQKDCEDIIDLLSRES